MIKQLSAAKILQISILVALLISAFWGLFYQATTTPPPTTTTTALTSSWEKGNDNNDEELDENNNSMKNMNMGDDMDMDMDDDMNMDMDDDSMDNDKSKFCQGMMSMTMAMGGFQFSLNKKGDCLTYFVSPWKLNSAGKFHGAMIYSFLLALMTEGITAFQLLIRKYLPSKGKFRKIVMTTLYGIQQWLGYITMLITMMYSIELFGCVIAGIVVGRILFSKHIPDNVMTSVGGGGGGGSVAGGSTSYRSISSSSSSRGNNNRRRRRIPPMVEPRTNQDNTSSSSSSTTTPVPSSTTAAAVAAAATTTTTTTNLRRRRS